MVAGVAAVRKVNSIAVTPNSRAVKPKRPFILSPPEESLRRRNATPWTALVYRERCCRPSRRCRLDERDVGRIEAERGSRSRYMVRPARQLGKTLPQWIRPSDATNSNEVWETLSTKLLTTRRVD